MKKKRFSVEQIVGVLKQAEVGVPVVELIRKAGISEQTFYRWKAKVGFSNGLRAYRLNKATGRSRVKILARKEDGPPRKCTLE
jgi:Transposase